MRMKLVLLSVGAMLCAACAPPADDATAKQLAALETKVDMLQKRDQDVRLKVRIVSQIFGSPLENFFASDEFWENPYDSGQADCAKRCIAELSAANTACAAIADQAKRLACFQDATARASRCQTQCSKNFPPQIP
jgi:hypothetical protein